MNHVLGLGLETVIDRYCCYCSERVFSRRHAYPCDATPGHAADAGQRPPAMLLCLLHLWHHWRATLVRPAAQPMLPRVARPC